MLALTARARLRVPPRPLRVGVRGPARPGAWPGPRLPAAQNLVNICYQSS